MKMSLVTHLFQCPGLEEMQRHRDVTAGCRKVLVIEQGEMKEMRFGPSILFHSNENTAKLSHPKKFPFNKQPLQLQSPLESGF